jgi:hypothetical protein
MFTARFHIASVRPRPAPARAAGTSQDRASRAGGILPMAALSGFLALGLPGTASAQALGTMQVTARVVPASAAWTGLAEAGVVARSVARQEPGRPLIRRNGLVQARAEIRPSGGRRLLLVTIHHPHN